MDKDEKIDGLAGKGWHAGETFFEESGGKPALRAGKAKAGADDAKEDAHQTGSDDDDGGITDEGAEPQSWPGKGGPGTFPPPG